MRSRMTTTTMRAAITATGHYLPPDVYPNAYFEQQLDTTDAWIRSRTGIAERRFASAGGTSDLIMPAAGRCLDARGVSATTVDCIIVATMTPDRPCPSTAAPGTPAGGTAGRLGGPRGVDGRTGRGNSGGERRGRSVTPPGSPPTNPAGASVRPPPSAWGSAPTASLSISGEAHSSPPATV